MCKIVLSVLNSLIPNLALLCTCFTLMKIYSFKIIFIFWDDKSLWFHYFWVCSLILELNFNKIVFLSAIFSEVIFGGGTGTITQELLWSIPLVTRSGMSLHLSIWWWLKWYSNWSTMLLVSTKDPRRDGQKQPVLQHISYVRNTIEQVILIWLKYVFFILFRRSQFLKFLEIRFQSRSKFIASDVQQEE